MKCAEEKPCTSFDSVKYWFVTGGSLRRALAVQFFKNVQPNSWLINLFGGMETLDFVTFQIFKSLKDIKSCLYYKIIPMGSPVINTRLYIVDVNGKVLGGSGHGEIYIAGLCATPNPESMRSLNMIEDGPVIKANPFFNEAKDNPIFKTALKTRDFGQMVYNMTNRDESFCSCVQKHMVTTVFAGHSEGTVLMENYRVNTNEVISYLKRCPGVKGCHVMVYRPGTNSKMILAFIVMSLKVPMTKDEIYKYLQARIPGYMMPTLIFIPGIPVRNFKINTSSLVEYFQKERISKSNATSYVELGFLPRELKAVESLMKILYYYCGGNKRWVATHMDWTLDELRIPYTRTPKVLIELVRRGYKIDMDEFFRLKTPQEILNLMIKRAPPPLINGQIFEEESYLAEIIQGKHKKELLEVTVRCKKTRKLVAALFNCDHVDKIKFKQWADLGYPMKYRMEMIDKMDTLLEERGLINGSDSVSLDSLQTLFLVYDPKSTNWDYKENIDIFQTLIAGALELARKTGFKSMYLMAFDHVSEEFVIDLFGFEVIETMQVNQFVSSDGAVPFHLVPDYVCGSVLYKKL
ncbi:unnamed protein product [Orchesella dallaii]|uniref:Uncharacterized protein n=1 Tax=Orchesella dallaii TaxID=48710 RepID=A0ABP1QI42_9HEXA